MSSARPSLQRQIPDVRVKFVGGRRHLPQLPAGMGPVQHRDLETVRHGHLRRSPLCPSLAESSIFAIGPLLGGSRR